MQNETPNYQILKDSYRELQSQMEAQFLHSAIEQVELFLKYNPGHAAAHNDLGGLYYRKDEKLQALGHYQKATRLAPDNAPFQKNLANFYLKEMGWVEEASALFQEVLKSAPGDCEALMALATISSGAGRIAEARAFLERILTPDADAAPAAPPFQGWQQGAELSSSPGSELRGTAPQPAPFQTQPPRRKSGDELYREALDCAEKGSDRQAIALLEELLSNHPEHALAHNDLGVLYLREGDAARSLERHRKACLLEPGNVGFAKNLAGLYLDQGMTDEAIHALLEQLRRHPEDTEILAALGNVSLAVDRPAEARSFFEKILSLEPWNQRAREAVAALTTPAAPQPPPPSAVTSTPGAAAAAARPDGEAPSLDQLLAKLRASGLAAGGREESAEELYRQAQESVAAGRPDEAVDRLEALSGRYPGFAPALNDLGVLYFQRGDRERALSRHRQALSLAPENLDFTKNLAGLCLTDPATQDEGILLLTRIVQSHPGDVETLFTLGRICRDLERPEEARIFLGRLLETEPWHREAQELLRQVSQTV